MKEARRGAATYRQVTYKGSCSRPGPMQEWPLAREAVVARAASKGDRKGQPPVVGLQGTVPALPLGCHPRAAVLACLLGKQHSLTGIVACR
ncbi:hypothetical protein BHE74_00044484 [Ensete ventricosum]|nr:hypothetical protein BHE74_00044484 [Ensete ventricosum]RZS24720.1 hypothetical protein BHM03_00057822 [Ensete ventricosum]